MFVYALIILSVLTPALYFFPVRMKGWVALALISLAAALGIYTACSVLLPGHIQEYSGTVNLIFTQTRVTVDNISALFLLIISLVSFSVALYAKGYLAGYIGKKPAAHLSLHYMSLCLLCFSMLFVVCSRDAFGFLFGWELMTVSSFVLILFEAEKKQVRRAALSYLVQMHVGFALLLAGFVVSWAATGISGFDALGVYFADRNPVPLFAVFFAGFGMKAGVFPLHGWLPEAHPAAPSHISALMSGVMIKMGVYGVVRVLCYIETGLFTVGLILFIAGVVTGLWGIIVASIQNEIKKLLAYSSIENIGVIFIALGAAVIGRGTGNDLMAGCALAGALLHTLNHSLFKSLLFMGAGNVYTATHTTSLDSLGGLAKKMPLTAALFLVGVLAISALPPLNGFVSEFLIYFSLIEGVAIGQGGVITSICAIVALSLIGGMVLLAFTKLFGVVFLGEARMADVNAASEVDRWRLVACAVPVAGIVLIGLLPWMFTGGIFAIAAEVFPNAEGMTVDHSGLTFPLKMVSLTGAILIALIAAILAGRKYFLRRQVVEHSPTWGCGFTANTSRMQYSGESFSEGLYGITTSLTNDSVEGDVVDKNEIFPTQHSFRIRHKDRVSTLISRWWSQMVGWLNKRIMKLNTGKVNHYILYALMFLALILIISVFDWI